MRAGLKLLIVTGEASGDLYGSLLSREIRALAPEATVLGAGSDRMRAAGVEILGDPTAFASIGFVEALSHLLHYKKLFSTLRTALEEHRPDALVLIDFPDFNLRLAPHAHRLGIPIIYYISPQVWAWRPGRIKQIRRWVKKMLVIFPFETRLYEEAGVPVGFVGHPMLDVIAGQDAPTDLRAELQVPSGATLIGLLPGSRMKQFRALLPRMTEAAGWIRETLPSARFVIAGARTIPADAPRPDTIPFLHDRTHDVFSSADAILTASGTATVEAALYGVPMVVTYWVHPLAALLGGLVLTVERYAMVNILAGREIVPELYQFKAKPARMAQEMLQMLKPERRETVRRDLAAVTRSLGGPGASRRAAEEILSIARGSQPSPKTG